MSADFGERISPERIRAAFTVSVPEGFPDLSGRDVDSYNRDVTAPLGHYAHQQRYRDVSSCKFTLDNFGDNLFATASVADTIAQAILLNSQRFFEELKESMLHRLGEHYYCYEYPSQEITGGEPLASIRMKGGAFDDITICSIWVVPAGFLSLEFTHIGDSNGKFLEGASRRQAIMTDLLIVASVLESIHIVEKKPPRPLHLELRGEPFSPSMDSSEDELSVVSLCTFKGFTNRPTVLADTHRLIREIQYRHGKSDNALVQLGFLRQQIEMALTSVNDEIGSVENSESDD